jgi:hypothetical protein
MSESVPSRDIELADTYNLRDLGGYPTVDGRRVAWRRLFRGASLQRLGGADAAVVGALGLRTAIDLRTVGEAARSGAYPTDVLPATLHRWPMIAAVWDMAGLDPDEPAERYLLARLDSTGRAARATRPNDACPTRCSSSAVLPTPGCPRRSITGTSAPSHERPRREPVRRAR